jgi:hypothetical protein
MINPSRLQRWNRSNRVGEHRMSVSGRSNPGAEGYGTKKCEQECCGFFPEQAARATIRRVMKQGCFVGKQWEASPE